jgi:hypothetical protein
MRRLILAGTGLFLFTLAFDLYPGLRGGAGWRWPYVPGESLLAVIGLALALAGYLVGVRVLRGRAVWLNLLWFVLAGAGVLYAVVGVRGMPGELLFMRAVSPVQTGASTVAVRYMAADGVVETLDRWTDFMAADAKALNLIHFTTSPPGQALAHHAVANLLQDSVLAEPVSYALRPAQCTNQDVMVYTRGEITAVGVFGVLMPLWAALLAVPVYWAGWLLTEDRKTALSLAAWSPLVPTIGLFLPVWNVVYPMLCAWSFALLVAGLRREKPAYHVGAGLVLGLTTLLNFAVLPVLGIVGLFTLGWHLRAGVGQIRRAVLVGVWFGVGLGLPWLIYGAATGDTPLAIWQVAQAEHRELVQRDQPLAWLILHPYDTLTFLGWPLAGLFLLGVWRAVRRRVWEPVDLLAVASVAVFLLVNVLGLVQGENGRILSFYAPFFLLAGGGILLAHPAGWDWGLLAGQAITVLVMATVLSVVPLDLNPPPDEPRTDIARLDDRELIPVETTLTSADFRGEVRLESYRFVADVARQAITLETVWQGMARTERPYLLEVVARAENEIDGAIVVPAQRWPAQAGNYLPTCWRAGDVVADVRVLDLPVISAPVRWTLDLRLVDPRTGDVMQITGTDETAVPLGPVNYP